MESEWRLTAQARSQNYSSESDSRSCEAALHENRSGLAKASARLGDRRTGLRAGHEQSPQKRRCRFTRHGGGHRGRVQRCEVRNEGQEGLLPLGPQRGLPSEHLRGWKDRLEQPEFDLTSCADGGGGRRGRLGGRNGGKGMGPEDRRRWGVAPCRGGSPAPSSLPPRSSL